MHLSSLNDRKNDEAPSCMLQTHFTPHPELSHVASTLGQDAQLVVTSAMQGKCGHQMVVSCGLLCCISDSAQLLGASEEAYQKTESSYLSTLVCYSISEHGRVSL